MKKLIILMAVLFAAVCVTASAEEKPDSQVSSSVEEGLLVVRIPLDEEDAGSWDAEMHDLDADRSMTLLSAEVGEDYAVYSFAPANDGWDQVDILHYADVACDEFYQIMAEVQDGVFSGEMYTEHITSPKEDRLDPYMIGEWPEAETQFRTLKITDLEGPGWGLEVVSPISHGAYRFTATIHYDCIEDALAFANGTLYELFPTGEDSGNPAGEEMEGCVYIDVTAEEDGQLTLIWEDPVTDETVYFLRNGEDVPDVLVPEILDLGAGDDVMPDGVYWADINPEDLRAGSLADVIFYTADVYSGTDIRQVTPGEMIVRDLKIYWAEAVAEDGSVTYTSAVTGESGTMGFLNIPGGDEYVAIDLSGSQLPMISFQNIADTPMAGDVKMLLITDGLKEEPADTDTMAKAIESDDAFFDCRTVVRIMDGSITEIRHYADVPIADMMTDVRSLDPKE